MQRQSLGSPSSKLFYGRGGGENGIIISHSPSSTSTASSLISPSSSGSITTACSTSLFPVDDEEIKLEKKAPRRRSSIYTMYHSRPERFIHLIPILLLLCLLVLYLCSHEPSATDLADINGFRHPSDLIIESDIDKNMEQLYMEKREMIGIHSLRNLQEITSRKDPSLRKSNRHRKLADF